MRSVRSYWAGRLNDHKALWGYAENGRTHRGPWPWPDWLSRKDLYEDYCSWYCGEYWLNYPRHLRGDLQSATKARFLGEIHDYIAPGRNTASYFPVTEARRSRGAWTVVTVRRKFIRLPDYVTAKAHFTFYTEALDKAQMKAYCKERS